MFPPAADKQQVGRRQDQVAEPLQGEAIGAIGVEKRTHITELLDEFEDLLKKLGRALSPHEVSGLMWKAGYEMACWTEARSQKGQLLISEEVAGHFHRHTHEKFWGVRFKYRTERSS